MEELLLVITQYVFVWVIGGLYVLFLVQGQPIPQELNTLLMIAIAFLFGKEALASWRQNANGGPSLITKDRAKKE